jgi:shikimate 5-dehydrogenase
VEVVEHGLRLAPDFITLNLSLDDERINHLLRQKGSTRTIAHCYSSNPEHGSWTHPFWIASYVRARTLGFDVVRICWPARSIDDNYAISEFRNKIKALGQPVLPLIAYNTGSIGKTSSCFNPTMTPVTHDDIPLGGDALITATQSTEALYKSFILEPMRFYIMGASAGYSLSPAMHMAAYKVCGMPHSYSTCQTNTLHELQRLKEDPHFGGCSISLPFKVEIISLTHSLSKHGKAIGAINTLLPVRHLRPDGSIPDDLALFGERNRSGPVLALYGENTDWIGIRACVRTGLSPANAVTPRSTALIIGAGGMARAAVYAVLQLGVRNIFIHNRTAGNTRRLIEHFRRLPLDLENGAGGPAGETYADAGWHFAALDSRDDEWPDKFDAPNIIISAIPTHGIGENPSPRFVLPPQWLRSKFGGVVMELAYRNIRTPLMEQIRMLGNKGWVPMDGLDLLPEQGFAQFELFTGRRAPRRLMRAEVLRNYRDENGKADPEYIQWRLDALDGYMQ